VQLWDLHDGCSLNREINFQIITDIIHGNSRLCAYSKDITMIIRLDYEPLATCKVLELYDRHKELKYNDRSLHI
jgi:hypothetical protein